MEMGRALSYVLELLDRLDLVDQERIAVVPAELLQLFSKALKSYQLVFVLSTDGTLQPPGRWRVVRSRRLELRREFVLLPASELADYEELARVLSSYVSPRRTSFVTAIAGIRDGSLVLAYKLLKLMRRLGATPHVFLVLDVDYRDLSDVDKANVASAVSAALYYLKHTILPFSASRAAAIARRMMAAEYVEECLSRLMERLHENPARGTYVPLCFRLEPASVFRDARSALNLVFFAFTGLLELSPGRLSLGSIRVWRGSGELEGLGGGMSVEYIEEDRLDVAALAEFSLRDIVAEGARVISRAAPTEEAAEVLMNLSLSMARV